MAGVAEHRHAIAHHRRSGTDQADHRNAVTFRHFLANALVVAAITTVDTLC